MGQTEFWSEELTYHNVRQSREWPTSDVGDRQAELSKVGWASAADTVEGRKP